MLLWNHYWNSGIVTRDVTRSPHTQGPPPSTQGPQLFLAVLLLRGGPMMQRRCTDLQFCTAQAQCAVRRAFMVLLSAPASAALGMLGTTRAKWLKLPARPLYEAKRPQYVNRTNQCRQDAAPPLFVGFSPSLHRSTSRVFCPAGFRGSAGRIIPQEAQFQLAVPTSIYPFEG